MDAAAKSTSTYTVVKGDSWASVADKFKTTRKKLKKLNNLTATTLKPGQILLVPAALPKNSAKTAKAGLTRKAKLHHDYAAAQPVQDFDIPASTFGTCPVPMPPDEDTQANGSTSPEEHAPIAQLVSPAEMSKADAEESPSPQAEIPPVAANREEPGSLKKTTGKSPTIANKPTNVVANPPSSQLPPMRLTSHAPATNAGSDSSANTANDWGNRFLQEARYLGSKGIEYNEDWRPPGESRAWTMDCSNTARYIYKAATGIQLPRTASDQYYYLHQQGKAWDVPQTADGWADTNYLRRNLKPGDLLFWENTYRPERQPPITHVMVFLGTNEKGEWIMAGSQSSRGGEHNRRNGGPDVYVFHPAQPCGGYTTWIGLVHHRGRFCAFGRPLEADPTKLAVVESN